MTNSMGPPPPRSPNITTKPPPDPPSSPPPPLKTPMGPPPPPSIPVSPETPTPPKPITEHDDITIKPDIPDSSSSSPIKTTMGPPPPLIPITKDPVSPETETPTSQIDPQPQTENEDNTTEEKRPTIAAAVPYTIPPWSEPPCHPYYLEVLKDGSIITQFHINEKGAYMFGRVDLCDFVLDHPTISRFHAVLQFKRNGDAYIYDLSSTHGTFINKNQVTKKVYTDLHVGDVIRFGHSSRLYIFQGPSELMLPEKDLKKIRSSKLREEMRDMEASLRRAKLEASLADGVTWGMDEDAIEENEEDIEEITWQTYKGQLTEKQEKTRDKVIKRLEKIANMKKEIDAIRAKDISQGGLTQGQQTQIARNEQRMSQIMEELENLEETLNESIRESLGARTGGISRGKKKGATEEDEDEYVSDDDEFYDRAKKPLKPKGGENQSIETADSLLDKKDAIIKEMEDRRTLIADERNKLVREDEVVADVGDALDAYMTNLSSQLVVDKTEQLEKELDTLQSELDRILYLLKIADPTGEASRKRESRAQEPKLISSIESSSKQNKERPEAETNSRSIQKQGTDDITIKSSEKPVENSETVAVVTDSKPTVYTVVKPQWLGAVEKNETKPTQQEAPLDTPENDGFVDYKDRKKALVVDSGLENAAPGLIIRKRKQVDKSETEVKGSEEVSVSSVAPEIEAEDAVALLLKHTRGYRASDDEMMKVSDEMAPSNQSGKGKKRPKKVIGPQKPPFLDSEPDYEAWVPPAGQSGDGRTSLNDRLGY